MLSNQSDIIIQRLKDGAVSFSEIFNLKASEIIFFDPVYDLKLLAQIIADYFKINVKDSVSEAKLTLNYPDGTESTLTLKHEVAFGLILKDFTGNSRRDKVKRITDQTAVYKKLKQVHLIQSETARFLSSTSKIVSEYALSEFRNKKMENQKYLASAKRRKSATDKANELHATCKQLQELAVEMNYSWLFITITCPSKFHLRSDSYDRAYTAASSNDFLCRIWKNVFRKLSKKKISPLGHWSKEPHDNAALHKHALLYCRPEDLSELKKWLSHFTKQAFESENSVFIPNKSIQFDAGRCQATGIPNGESPSSVCNYINKHILSCLNPPMAGTKEAKTEEKCEAHADIFRYRRYGFVGIKRSLTLWRHVKKFSFKTLDNTAPTPLNELLKMAKLGKFAEFLRSPHVKNMSLIHYAESEKGSLRNNKYDEPVKKAVGFKHNDHTYMTPITAFDDQIHEIPF